MIKKHKVKVILFAIGMFILKSYKYYNHDDTIESSNHTLQEELLELGENILEI